MTYTASNLITEAYHLSHILQVQVEAMNATYSEKGINALNEILAAKSFETQFIPYYQQYNLTAIPGQEEYFIPGLVDPVSFTFNIDSVRYGSNYMSRREYFTRTKAESVNALPFRWHTERAYQMYNGVMTVGTNLYVTFSPSQTFPFRIWGKFALNQVALTDDMSLFYDPYFSRYIKYALASELCRIWDVGIDPNVKNELNSIEMNLDSMNPPDLTPIRINPYDEVNMINYAQVNIGMGNIP